MCQHLIRSTDRRGVEKDATGVNVPFLDEEIAEAEIAITPYEPPTGDVELANQGGSRRGDEELPGHHTFAQ
jgi:hypothetical protein